jgi:hypothetical protein
MYIHILIYIYIPIVRRGLAALSALFSIRGFVNIDGLPIRGVPNGDSLRDKEDGEFDLE